MKDLICVQLELKIAKLQVYLPIGIFNTTIKRFLNNFIIS